MNPSKQAKWYRERNEKIARMYQDGINRHEIAQKYGMSYLQIYKICKAYRKLIQGV